jgi:integrase
MNDYDDLKRRRIKRFLPEDESDHYAIDRPYSIKEIDQVLSKCDVRSKVAVLIMLSSGMRIGGLRELRIGDIKKIDEFGLYLIWVYNRSGKDRYYTICSPECAVAIDEYLAYCKRIGEELKDKSPLIRDRFSQDNYFKAPKFLTLRAMSLLFEEVLKKAGVNHLKPGQKKREVMRSHGLRKFFITQCDKSHMPFTVREYLSGHRLPNQNASYVLPINGSCTRRAR